MSPIEKDNGKLRASVLYIIDVGLSNSPAHAYKSGRILVGSGDGRPLRAVVEHDRAPDGVDVNMETSQLFWTDMGIPSENDGSINCSDLEGYERRVLICSGNVHTPKQICIDRTNKKLYFCDREGLRVMRCNLDGSEHETIVQNGDWRNTEHTKDQKRWCVGIAVAAAEGKFYWSQKGPCKGFQGRIFCANIKTPAGERPDSRSDIECLFSGLPEPIDLDIDEETSTLYWTDRGELPYGNSLNKASITPLKDKTPRSMPSPSAREGKLGHLMRDTKF